MNTKKNGMARMLKLGVWGLIALTLSATVLNPTASAQLRFGPQLGLANPTSLIDFGRRLVNGSGDPVIVTLTNAGSGKMIINSASVGGANPADFTVLSNTCNGAILLPGGLCGVTVSFVPKAVGVRTARVIVYSNAPNSTHQIPLNGVGLDPSIPNRAVSASDPLNGFPYWYQDDAGTRLTLCLDASLCLAAPLNPALPPAVTDSLINLPGEVFWWSAEAEIARPGGLEEAELVMAKEAAFTTEDAAVGKQISFDRVRVRIEDLVPGATYTVTYPFGVLTFVADGDGEIDETEDIGCGAAPCDFRASLVGKISHFLRWDPAFAPAAPAGYVGDPNFPHRVTGSPLNTNYFRVDGPNVGGPGVNSIQTDLFAVQGKLF